MQLLKTFSSKVFPSTTICLQKCFSSEASPQKKLGLKNVKHIIAVSSAKGGVGKSTTSVNLAVSLATTFKQRVGILDGDIYGPSVPKMLNLSGQPTVNNTGLMNPKENYRVKSMSFGYFLEGDAPVVWRGPMVKQAFDKLLFGTDWGALDILVVDMPPGTGDTQINLAQRIPLSGAVLISTPQDVAMIDVRRGAQMFMKTHVALLGVVGNMTVHKCRNCGHEEHLFGHGGVQAFAEEYKLRVLADLPLDVDIQKGADRGVPVTVGNPDSASTTAYAALAQSVMEELAAIDAAADAGANASVAGPKITIE